MLFLLPKSMDQHVGTSPCMLHSNFSRHPQNAGILSQPCVWKDRDAYERTILRGPNLSDPGHGMMTSVGVGERRRLQESAVQEGHLEQITTSSQQQLESMKAVCSALLAQVDRIGSQLSGKEEEVLELRSRLQNLP